MNLLEFNELKRVAQLERDAAWERKKQLQAEANKVTENWSFAQNLLFDMNQHELGDIGTVEVSRAYHLQWLFDLYEVTYTNKRGDTFPVTAVIGTPHWGLAGPDFPVNGRAYVDGWATLAVKRKP